MRDDTFFPPIFSSHCLHPRLDIYLSIPSLLSSSLRRFAFDHTEVGSSMSALPYVDPIPSRLIPRYNNSHIQFPIAVRETRIPLFSDLDVRPRQPTHQSGDRKPVPTDLTSKPIPWPEFSGLPLSCTCE